MLLLNNQANDLKATILQQGLYYKIIIYTLVSGQTSSVGDMFDSYEIRIDRLVRIIDLFKPNLNQ